MRILALLLLIANVLFFTWRFNVQLEDELAARRRAPPLPAHAPSLTLLRELPHLPPERETPPEDSLMATPDPSAADDAGVATAEAGATSPVDGTGTPTTAANPGELPAPGSESPTVASVETSANPAAGASAGGQTAGDTPPVVSASEASASPGSQPEVGSTAAAPVAGANEVAAGSGTAPGSAPATAPDAAAAGAPVPGDNASAEAASAPVVSANGTSPPVAVAAQTEPSAEAPASAAPGTPGSAADTSTTTQGSAESPAASINPPDLGTASVAATPPVPAANPAQPGATNVPSGVCLRAGPFERDLDTARLKAWLATRSTHLAVVHEGAAQKPLFGIYLEPRSASEREENLRDLARRGVHDYLPVKRAGMEHAISLGVYSTQENVNRRLAEIQRQGYRPIVVPRRDAGGQRYVEAELAVGFEDPARVPPALLGSATVKSVTCKR